MIRRFIAAILLCVPAWSLSNAVRVTETLGATQTNHPVTISRYFAKGEIPAAYACVQPYIDGVAATIWQCEKKNTHADGSLKWALISLKIPLLTANGTVEIDFRPSVPVASGSGHTKEDLLSEPDWNADMRFQFNHGTAEQWEHTVDARTMLSSLTENAPCADPADSWLRGLRTWTNGPVATMWIVEDKCRTRAFDFGATHDGSKWNAPTDGSFRTLHPWFVLTAYWDYPSAGQVTVAVDYVVEQPWRSIYQNVQYRPRFRDQNLSHVVEERLLADFDHWKEKTYFFRGWASTTSVPRTLTDHNLPYLIHSGVIPPYAQRPMGANDKLFDDTAVDTFLTFYKNQYQYTVNGETEPYQYARGNKNCQSPYQTDRNCALQWNKDWQMSGQSPVYIIVPEPYVQWLYIMGNPNVSMPRKLDWWDTLIIGAADVAGSTYGASFLEDTATTEKYCGTWCNGADQNLLAFGLPVSNVAYPNYSGMEGAIPNWMRKNTPAGTVCGNATWPCAHNSYGYVSLIGGTSAFSHAQSPWFVPTLLTGHPYYHEQLMRQAATGASAGNAGGSSLSTRNGTDLWLPYLEWRARPQTMKLIVQAWALAPKPLAEYFDTFLRRNIAIEEGRIDVPVSESYFASSAYSALFAKGRDDYRDAWNAVPVTTNPTNFALNMPSLSTGAYSGGAYLADNTVIHTAGAWWMTQYLLYTYAHAVSLGLDYMRPVAKATSRYVQRQIQIAPLAPADYTIMSAMLKPTVRKEVFTATYDAARSKLVLDFAAPHGWTGTYNNAYLCCIDPLWTGGWQTKTWTNYGASMTVVDADTVEIPWTTAMTGVYHADGFGCCGTSRQKLRFAAFNSNDAAVYQGPPQSWTEFDTLWPIEAREYHRVFGGAPPYDYEGGPLAERTNFLYAPTMWLASMGLWDKSVAPDLRKNYQKYRAIRRYWDRFFSVSGSCTVGYCGHPGLSYNWKEQIENVSVVQSASSILFRFQAPTADPAKVAITTADAFADSRDYSDWLATCHGRDCQAVLPANSDTTYRYRITGGTHGVARLEGSIKTLAATDVPSAYTLALRTPPNRGISQVTVENGSTASYGTSQTLPCAAACTVTVSGLSGRLQYLRWTWKTSGGEAVGWPGERIVRVD